MTAWRGSQCDSWRFPTPMARLAIVQLAFAGQLAFWLGFCSITITTRHDLIGQVLDSSSECSSVVSSDSRCVSDAVTAGAWPGWSTPLRLRSARRNALFSYVSSLVCHGVIGLAVIVRKITGARTSTIVRMYRRPRRVSPQDYRGMGVKIHPVSWCERALSIKRRLFEDLATIVMIYRPQLTRLPHAG
ncbi:hypothetical protein LSAT2_013314 [Lamellibrachia satsuma]|nr:hypothetical protein LSAT2_013314 [Lamellibrachia satsuma]